MLSSFELLIIDELGFVPLSKTGAELLFEVFSRRYERSATLVTSNLPFNEWTEAFDPERLTGALLDRPAYPSRPHPGDERGKLPAQGQQVAAGLRSHAPNHTGLPRRFAGVGFRSGLNAPRKAGRRPTLQPPPQIPQTKASATQGLVYFSSAPVV